MIGDVEASATHPTLVAAVSAYRDKVAAGSAPAETVTLTLTRRGGFLNRAQAGSGHAIVVDEPRDFGGEGSAADPAELMLAAIGASLSVTLTAHAALRGLPIEHVAMRLSARMDAAAFFEPGGRAPAGLLDVGILLTLASPADPAALRALADDALRASPVAASLARPPALELRLESGR